MTKRVFYVVEFADADVQRVLDAIRFLSNPAEKGVAHITVRGPYRRHLKNDNVKDVAAKVAGTEISVDGLGTFFEHGQNTVFLKCSADSLRKVWMKRDYEYNPHVTLYDGTCRPVAQEHFDRLSQLDLHFLCKADGVSPHVSYKGQRTFDLRSAFDGQFISQLTRRQIDANAIDAMEWGERLSFIVRLAEHLPKLVASNAAISKSCITRRST